MLELILSFILGALVVLLHNKNKRGQMKQEKQEKKEQQERKKEEQERALGEESFSEKLQNTQGPVDDLEMVIKFLKASN